MRSPALAGLVIVAGAFVGACSGSDDTPAQPYSTASTAAPDVTAAPADAPAGTGGTRVTGTVANAIRPLPPAEAVPAPPSALAAPTGLTIEDLDLASAPVVAVGVEADGDMEIPDVDEVGWYRYGVRPGDEGSSVLAAHIAYDGVDGVFRHLEDLEAGATVTVAFAGGASRAFTVTDVAQYPKDELPSDVWARGGEPRLVLITCGGDFNPSIGHYEDNVLAYAVPA
ncbi:MAG TPA: class F sortase [Acidimicrobiales bacterium]|nr:class F sortase [Acidimicrobiales bacterium]